MKITRISVYRVELPIPGGVYAISGGRSYSACDDTVVPVETDADITGWGEVCALGAHYLPVFGAGARAGIRISTRMDVLGAPVAVHGA